MGSFDKDYPINMDHLMSALQSKGIDTRRYAPQLRSFERTMNGGQLGKWFTVEQERQSYVSAWCVCLVICEGTAPAAPAFKLRWRGERGCLLGEQSFLKLEDALEAVVSCAQPYTDSYAARPEYFVD